MLRTILWGLGGLVLGIALGALPIWFADPLTAMTRDGWRYNALMGSKPADPIGRALAANTGFLPMARAEALYFKTEADAKGQRLREECSYRLTVAAQPAAWWSLTIYRPLGGLPAGHSRAWSVDATQSVHDAGGGTTIVVAPQRGAGPNWISTEAAGDFSLWLRLYLPNANAADTAPLPRIERLSCGANA